MNTEFKGTKGKWSWHTTGLQGKIYEIINTPKYPALFMLNPKYKMDSELQTDIELVADAGNTIQSCGLLPSELLKQRDELRDFLRIIISSEMTPISYRKTAKKLLESTEGKAVRC